MKIAPPFITPLVLIADIDKAVIEVTAVVVKISNMPCAKNKEKDIDK